MGKHLNFAAINRVFGKCSGISRIKSQDYGTENLSTFMEKGLVVRMNDKMARIKNLVWNDKTAQVKDESAQDTCLDMINYSAYLYLMLRGELFIQENEKEIE